MAGLTGPAARILFVCLGNICRSPMAEGALRAAAERAGVTIEADSAGTGNWHIGAPPDTRAQAEALRNGVDIAAQRARQVSPADFHRYTYVFALDRQNLADLRQIAPSNGTAQLDLLLNWVDGREGQPVADPYFGDEDGFAQTWADVALAADAIIARITK